MSVSKRMHVVWLAVVLLGAPALSPALGKALAEDEKMQAAVPAEGSPAAVDCRLPSQVRQLGRLTTYLAPQREVRISAGDCELRGGELAGTASEHRPGSMPKAGVLPR